MTEEERARAIVSQQKIQDQWFNYMNLWAWIYYGLGIVGVALATLNAAKPFGLSDDKEAMALLGWVLALVTGINTFLRPSERFDRYRRAWSHLSVAISRYLADSTYILNDVLRAYEDGETVIHENQRATTVQNPPEGSHANKPPMGATDAK